MENDLKRAINTNYSDKWDSFTLDEAIRTLEKIVDHFSNLMIKMNLFANLSQG